jgi:hypothetical protein
MVKPRELARALNASNRGMFARQLKLALAPVAGSAQRLPRRRPLNRGIWIALGAVGLLALVAFGVGISAAVGRTDVSALDNLAPCAPL